MSERGIFHDVLGCFVERIDFPSDGEVVFNLPDHNVADACGIIRLGLKLNPDATCITGRSELRGTLSWHKIEGGWRHGDMPRSIIEESYLESHWGDLR